MREIAQAITRADTKKEFVLKGGTGLLLAYGLPRFSTDLDFDGKNPAFDISSAIRERTMQFAQIYILFSFDNIIVNIVSISYSKINIKKSLGNNDRASSK